jgi:hypothetical protein
VQVRPWRFPRPDPIVCVRLALPETPPLHCNAWWRMRIMEFAYICRPIIAISIPRWVGVSIDGIPVSPENIPVSVRDTRYIYSRYTRDLNKIHLTRITEQEDLSPSLPQGMYAGTDAHLVPRQPHLVSLRLLYYACRCVDALSKVSQTGCLLRGKRSMRRCQGTGQTIKTVCSLL